MLFLLFCILLKKIIKLKRVALQCRRFTLNYVAPGTYGMEEKGRKLYRIFIYKII